MKTFNMPMFLKACVEKPEIAKVFPELNTRRNNYQLSKRVKTFNMPMFLKACVVGVNFKKLVTMSRWWRKK